ncbi:MAG: NAD(P)H-hydrate epimerase [Planctomycetes bacterium]|nr:NAD(P)H-hydrate epimerase [Planctomycetota bacterium]
MDPLDPTTALTRRQMTAVDKLATARLGMPSLLLMENAGRGIADVVRAIAGAGPGRPPLILVVCGHGNNGGDGYVVARRLLLHGDSVRVLVVGREDEIRGRGDAGVNLEIAARIGVPIEFTDRMDRRDVEARIASAWFLVDALFGTGLSRPVEGMAKDVIGWMNQRGRSVPIVAVDIPSGLDCDTGEVLGDAVRAVVTVTVAAPKTGFFRGEGPRLVGELRLVDFGVPLGPLRAALAESPEGRADQRFEI